MNNINNIWFLRLDIYYITDKSNKEIDTLNIENPYIYSMHGICSTGSNTLKDTDEYKLGLGYIKTKDRPNLVRNLRKIKADFKVEDKENCIHTIVDMAIDIWIGDIIFVKVTESVIYICKIISDMQILDFNFRVLPSRHVEILGKLSVVEFYSLFPFAKNRVRKTLERVANKEQKIELEKFLHSFLEDKNQS